MNREQQINAALELIQDALRKGEIEERYRMVGDIDFSFWKAPLNTHGKVIQIATDPEHVEFQYRAKPMKAEDYCRLIMDAYPSSTMAYDAAEAILEALKND